jgi:hypothetical protein
MERVAFLLEDGKQLGCLLNPSSLLIRRTAGVEIRRSLEGYPISSDASDFPLMYTGGGVTELTLELLFDLSVAGSQIRTHDVRDLTAPLWNLAENTQRGGKLQAVRFLWGRSWNIRAVVAAIAESLELFSERGTARRSYLKMRLLRVPEGQEPTDRVHELTVEELGALPRLTPRAGPPLEDLLVHTVIGSGDARSGDRSDSERLDTIAFEAYGDVSLWRLIAQYNAIADPLVDLGGRILSIPPRTVLKDLP